MEVELKILIVEDEMLLAAELAMNLEALGYKVLDMLSSGKEVLDFLKTNDPPDLILMDIQLDGEMDGIETVKAIQK
ncbi:MAG: CheY-like chemotaxis protein, partial [Glaciecola sp.]